MSSAAVPGWQPVHAPARETIDGSRIRLEPLQPQRHAEDLWGSAAGDSQLWTYLPWGPFASRKDFTDWLEPRASCSDVWFVVVDKSTGHRCGLAAFMGIDRTHGTIEIGGVLFGAELQRTPQATETIFLLARVAFDLGYRRLEWCCNTANSRSKRAAERFGFTFEGIFRQHRVVKGFNRDTAWFSILDSEWPTVRAACELWLQPANFDDSGRQKETLEQRRAQVRIKGAGVNGQTLHPDLTANSSNDKRQEEKVGKA
jgi:RimJ/RimL family protein N-acetyltransferase